MYPNANIWMVGHSLGGSLASLVAQTFGVPAVAFEAPGDRLPAQRLHLPSPVGFLRTQTPNQYSMYTAIDATYHSCIQYGRRKSVPCLETCLTRLSQPIPQGTCTGVSSTCGSAGYALESHCHLGKIIKYDTVKKLGWRVNVQNHLITAMIDLLSIEDEWEEGREVPQPMDEEEDCVVRRSLPRLIFDLQETGLLPMGVRIGNGLHSTSF